ncbi:amidase [Penicillium herquei]|nr:amidase [Penicillium herquei]
MVGNIHFTTVCFIVVSLFLLLGSTPMFTIPNPFTDRASWQAIAAQKRHDIMAKIPDEWLLDMKVIEEARSRQSIAGGFFESLLDDQTRSITALDVIDLVESMRNKAWTAVQVVNAFSKRAAYAHQLGNYLLDIGFEQAIARAQELDNYVKEHDQLVGPLHGVPVTF